jgi:succinate dehydrogenase / fumarate reductase cytochrome b subunit
MPSRPVSPHLTVYRFMYTMSLSILHRMTGLAATVAFLAFVWWLMALASGAESYSRAMRLLDAPLVKLLLAGFAFSFVYHFCNGIRHLIWDTGRGLERVQARRSGAMVVVSALVLTALLIWLGCGALGLDPGLGGQP